jgi:UDP-galactopyranose mutase
VEHKHFLKTNVPGTVITKEYPSRTGIDAYPINTDENNLLHSKYMQKAKNSGILVGGRLGSYKYMDMHQAIGQAMNLAEKELTK